MTRPLPPPIRQRLTQTLAQWREWDPPPAREPAPAHELSGGRSNYSVLVSDGRDEWVVRVDGVEPAALGLNRAAEYRAMAAAAAKGIAPRPAYRNPTSGALAYRYHPGRPDTTDGSNPQAIADLLREIHQLPLNGARLDPLERAEKYLALLGEGWNETLSGGESEAQGGGGARGGSGHGAREAGDGQGGSGLPTGFVDACRRREKQRAARVLCHNDLLAANRIRAGGRLIAIDWEYAAAGDPGFDLAAVIEGDGLGDDGALELLKCYLGRKPNADELTGLADWREIYRGLSALWERAMGGMIAPSRFPLARE